MFTSPHPKLPLLRIFTFPRVAFFKLCSHKKYVYLNNKSNVFHSDDGKCALILVSLTSTDMFKNYWSVIKCLVSYLYGYSSACSI